MKVFAVVVAIALLAALHPSTDAFSLEMRTLTSDNLVSSSRRSFFSSTAASLGALASIALVQPAEKVEAASPAIYKLDSGITYATLKEGKGSYPQAGDIVAIEYTGYLTNGAIFDKTHSEGSQNALLFKLGSTAVIPGINDMVAEMKVGQKVQAIIPAELAFGDKGICIENKEGKEECLVKPGSKLVYDIYLKKSSIPPP
ncbi:peptidylprolyl isomerase [Nitzschia inconspicua]|uniref:peptidylprolyl isomerase n=1 Tax=Nitzschia inconspicua TaxID=303405 RepID=A0A9K3LLW2_9STRA|nr:peptidylprolyl isomerase [Nitzschia inconspicua]